MVITGVNTVTYNGDGNTTAFPFSFQITDCTEIYLQLVNEDGTVTNIPQGSGQDYYVDEVNNIVHYPGYAPGAEKPEADRPPKVKTGQKLIIYRDVPMTQERNLGAKWPFSVTERALDKLTMICQQIYSYTNRTLDAAIASMLQLAGVVMDSGKLQHITDQLNKIDEKADAAAASATLAQKWANYTNGTVAGGEYSAKKYATDASGSASSASNSAASAATSAQTADTVATALTDIYNDAIDQGTIVAPAIDKTLSVSGGAADAKIVGKALTDITDSTLIAMSTEDNLAINTTTTPISTTPVYATPAYRYAVVSCSPGDVFTINATGGSLFRAYCFADSSLNVLIQAAVDATINNLIITAPANAAYLIINDKSKRNSYYENANKTAENTKNIEDANCVDCWNLFTKESSDRDSVYYTVNADGSYTISGTTTNGSFHNLCAPSKGLPYWFVPGKTYRVKYKSDKVKFAIYYNNAANTLISTFTDVEFTIPNTVVDITMQFAVAAGTTVSETVRPQILTTYANAELATITKAINLPIKEYTDADCISAFVTEMNNKASKLGMADTIFYSPSGSEKNSKSTCKDLLMLGLMAFSNNLFVESCSLPSIALSVAGKNARTINVVNQYLGAATNVYKDYGKVLGGKGGNLKYTLTDEYYRTQLTLVEVSEKPVLIALMATGQTSYNAIYQCGKELVNVMKAKIDGTPAPSTPNLDTLVADGGEYGAIVCPPINGSVYGQNYGMIYTYNSVTQEYEVVSRDIDMSTRENAVLVGSGQMIPCSVTKCMTALLASEYIIDRNLNIVIQTSDIESGSGSTYYKGDVINIVDALTMMMLESSNTLANAIARTLGFLIANR